MKWMFLFVLLTLDFISQAQQSGKNGMEAVHWLSLNSKKVNGSTDSIPSKKVFRGLHNNSAAKTMFLRGDTMYQIFRIAGRADTIKVPHDKRLFIAKQKPGVYNLPLDNMPCIVPDPHASVAMPNAFGAPQIPFRTRIPNAAPQKDSSRYFPMTK
jgi:hypothetical protein